MANQNMRDFFSAIAVQAGIDTESETFKSMIENEALQKITVPDEISTGIQTNLLTLKSAMNHADVAKHFKGKYYSTTDRAFKEALKGVGMTDEMIGELDKETDTIKKLGAGVSKYSEYLKSTLTSNGDGDKKYQETVKKFNDLQKQYNDALSGFAQKEQQWHSDLENKEVQWELNNMLSSYNYSENYQPDDVKLLATARINNLPYIFKKVEGKVAVFQKDNPDLVANKNNKPLSPKDVIDEVVSPYVKKSQTTTAKTDNAKPVEKIVAASEGGAKYFAEKNQGRNAEILQKHKEEGKL